MACQLLGITERSVQRWRKDPQGQDQRRGPKARPAHALSNEEHDQMLKAANSPQFCDLSPAQIVSRLADEGRYIASESSFYRLLRQRAQNKPRQPSKTPQRRTRPEAVASAANQVWVWDITYLPTPTQGRYLYLYLVLDLFSRKIVGWRVEDRESGAFAAELMEECILEEQTAGRGLVLHSDNGAPMKSSTLSATLERLEVARSLSRPRVSNDNAFAESSFRTMKYRPSYPKKALGGVEQWRSWVRGFVQWYNEEHRHSGIGFVTPSQRHEGLDTEILKRRRQVYEQAKQRNPRRWTTKTRAWSRPATVRLTPERTTTHSNHTRQLS